MDNGSSSHGPAFVRGRPPRPKHWDPEVVFTNSKAAGGAGVLGEEFAAGGAPVGSAGAPPTARGVGKISHGVNPMSPAAGYPPTGRSWVSPVGDACRLVKLRFRCPGIIFMDAQAAGGHRTTC